MLLNFSFSETFTFETRGHLTGVRAPARTSNERTGFLSFLPFEIKPENSESYKRDQQVTIRHLDFRFSGSKEPPTLSCRLLLSKPLLISWKCWLLPSFPADGHAAKCGIAAAPGFGVYSVLVLSSSAPPISSAIRFMTSRAIRSLALGSLSAISSVRAVRPCSFRVRRMPSWRR